MNGALICAGIVVFVALIFPLITGGIHTIEEGHVGIYYYGGQLSKTITEPGIHVLIPLLTTYHQVQISVQTDEVRNIPCGTSGGVMIYFDKIEVVNKLKKEYVYDTIKNYTLNYDRMWIYDKIHHEINQFCSQHTLQEVFIDLFETLDESLVEALQKDCEIWAPGIEILSIRVTKPRIPEKIKKNYEEIEAAKTQYLIVSENQKVKLQEAETFKQQETIKANSRLEVRKIELEKAIKERENRLKIGKIEDEMYLNKTTSEVDAEYYSNIVELQTLTEMLTESYLNYQAVDALTSNLTLYLGDSIPQVYIPNSIPKDKAL
jgi:regulator of protease activity HflC (stomatin/prohibitin superfamily)